MIYEYDENGHDALLREKLEYGWHDEDELPPVDEYEEERRRLNDQYWYW